MPTALPRVKAAMTVPIPRPSTCPRQKNVREAVAARHITSKTIFMRVYATPVISASSLVNRSVGIIGSPHLLESAMPMLNSVKLAAKKFDIVFASQPEEADGLTAVPVENQELVLITPKGHPLACAEEISLADTEGYRQVFFDRSSGIRRVIEKMFDDAGILPDIAYETEEDQVIAGLVAKGFGIAVVPYMDMLHKLDVEIMKIKSPSHERRFFMVTDDHVFMPPAAGSFMDFVIEKCCVK